MVDAAAMHEISRYSALRARNDTSKMRYGNCCFVVQVCISLSLGARPDPNMSKAQ